MVNLEVACKPDIEQDQATVLVVEDEVLIRLMIADALRSEGLTVIEASSGDEALSVLQSALPIQLLLTDIRMATELDGLALARAARPGLKLVVASSQVSSNEVAGLADAFFRKPYVVNLIVDRIKSLLKEAQHAGQ